MGKNKSFASKNSRTGTKSDVLQCQCGGVINTRSVFQDHKMKKFAICASCKKVGNRPRDLMSPKQAHNYVL